MSQLELNGSKVYISRYSNKVLNNDEYTPVSISLGLPKYQINYNINSQVYALAPGRNYFRSAESVFTERYLEGLEALGIEKVLNILSRLTEQGKDLVLLCFEDTDKEMCHRTLLANWIKEKKGLEVLELADPSKKKAVQSRATQISFW